MINCPYCGKLTDPQLDSCVHCGGFLKKQSGPRTARRSSQSSQTCPNCGALIQEGDIICVACGTNLLTGQKIAEERKQQAAAVAAGTSPGNTRFYIIGGVLAAVILIAAIVIVSVMMRDPVARAKRLASSNRMLDAIKLLETHTAKDTDDAAAYFELGKLYWVSNDMANAAQSFEKAARLDSSNDDAARFAVLSFAESRAPGNVGAQVAVLEKAVQENPSDAELQYLLGLARGMQQDYAGQSQAMEKARQLNLDNPAASRASAVAEALQGDLSKAEEQLGLADPASADTLAAAGIIASMKGDTANAAKDLQDALSAKTSIEEAALTRLGVLLVQQGNFGEALNKLNDAATRDPSNETARYFKAMCLDRQHLTAQALSEYEALSEKSGPYQSRAAVQAARLNLAQQNADRALQILGRVPPPTAPGEIAELETVRGRADMAASDPDGAQAAFRKATQADASYAPAHLEMGLMLIQRQDISEGVRELQRYLKLVDEKDPDSGASQVKALVDQLQRSVESGKSAETAATTNETAGIGNERGIS